MAINYHKHDLPAHYSAGKAIAIDTETMGLNPHRDRLCVVQISKGDGNADIVHIVPDSPRPENLIALLQNENILKIFHFGRFDIGILFQTWNIETRPVYCTKIASRLVRTYTDRHGLKDLTRELLGIDLSKQQQSSDWGAKELTQAQKEYAASDVLYLHALKDILDAMLKREGRQNLAQACFDFLPYRSLLDVQGWPETDIFAHS